ncbi:glycosyltransferase family 4 protein [Zhongshania sp.]|jgi:glycosyltransferase involved in cell wall biosynthesis|uniref:glycosyltransferase family 4 protein n=1 Tax=Zhongshania sp. TaxID=1971902 RepID=UPI0039E52E24
MKIIYLHQYFNTPDMNGGTRSYEMARRMVARGHEVHVITSLRERSDDLKWVRTNEGGINVHWLPVAYSNSMSYSKRVFAFFKFAFFSAARAQSIRADLVYATSTPLTICIPAIYVSRIKNIPMVFEVRDLWPELPIAMGALKSPMSRFLARGLERLAYKSSAAVVALSPGMRDGVVSAGYPCRRISVIPNACDIDMFSVSESEVALFIADRPWLGGDPLLVYAGTLGKINGVEYLVEMATYLKLTHPEVKVLVVGDGSERDKITSMAVDNAVLGINFFMEPSLPKRYMPALFGSATFICSLFVDIPEMRANSANKFFDGLAAGKPVLLNYGGWQRELVEEYQCGLVTWNMTLQQSAKKIGDALCAPEFVVNCGRNSLALAEDLFDRDVLAEKLIRVLEVVVGGDDVDFSVDF